MPISSFTEAGHEAFEADVKTQKAIIRCYDVIGEISKRLPLSLRAEYADIAWRKLISFRDFLAHNYDKIVLRFLWEAVEDVPNLRTAIEAMIRVMESDEGDLNDA